MICHLGGQGISRNQGNSRTIMKQHRKPRGISLLAETAHHRRLHGEDFEPKKATLRIKMTRRSKLRGSFLLVFKNNILYTVCVTSFFYAFGVCVSTICNCEKFTVLRRLSFFRHETYNLFST